jgi:hypothetical protein
LFHTSRSIITVGSLIVPALLSIQYNTSSSDFELTIYWSTWILSLLVTTCNGLQTLFRLDKKYYSLHTILEHLHSEGWQYLELSGKYSGFYTPTVPPTHENQFIYFCNAIEKIRMRQIEEEYTRVNETTGSSTTGLTTKREEGATAPHTSTAPPHPDSLIPPTPFNLNSFSPDAIQLFLKTISKQTSDEEEKPSAPAPTSSEGRKENTKVGLSQTNDENGSTQSLPVLGNLSV